MRAEPSEIRGLSSDQYGPKHRDHLVEQYKLYVEMADRISSKRIQANSFFLGLCTVLVAAGATIYGKGYRAPAEVVFIALLAVLLLCYTWWRQIRSYRQLNAAKFEVISLLERHLPFTPYSTEWEILGEGNSPERYRPLSSLEELVPLVFAIMFALLAIYTALFPS